MKLNKVVTKYRDSLIFNFAHNHLSSAVHNMPLYFISNMLLLKKMSNYPPTSFQEKYSNACLVIYIQFR